MKKALKIFSRKRHAKVTMYSTRYCGYCMRARQLLQRKGISFEEIIIDNNRDLWLEMEARSNARTVPQIFIGDTHVGGYNELKILEVEDKLDGLLFDNQ